MSEATARVRVLIVDDDPLVRSALRMMLGADPLMPSGPDDVRTQVIVLTTFDADELVRAAIRAGASGFLLKHTSPERLLSAVHRVVAGEPMLSPSVTRQMMSLVAAADADPRRAAARADLAGLSERERQVALAIGQGKSNAEIAAELYLSVATVKSHVTHLLTRWDVTNRVQIAIRVHDAGLI